MAAVTLTTSTMKLDSFSLKDCSKSSHVEETDHQTVVAREPPRTIDGLIRQQAQDGPNDIVLSYPSSGIDYVNYTFRQLDVFAMRVAQHYKSFIPQRSFSTEPEIVVGLLGLSDLEYFISILALTKLGHTILFLSTRISIEAYSSLLKATGANHLLIGESFAQTAKELQESHSGDLAIHQIAKKTVYEYQITLADLHTRLDESFDPAVETQKIAWIIHSSGSTGLPKPIFQTHHAALTNYASNLDMRGFITLPLYHAHGLSSVFRAISSKKQIYVYNASLPLTQEHLLNIMHRYDFQIFYGVPYALKLLGETAEGVAALARLKVVMFGGSACPDALGRRLVDNGVNLISHYGTTETGQLMTSFRPVGDNDWDYVRVSEQVRPFMVFEQRSPGIYELVVLDGLPSKVAANRSDNSYATKDLFTPHPSTPDAWKYYARLDETIVLMNGEKFTPISFEQAVRENHCVTEAVIFGSGKARIGMAIIPSVAATGLSPEEVLKELSPVLDAANRAAPAYAQLAQELILILPIGTEYPRTDKGTVIRAAFYSKFDKQIDAVYETLELPSGSLELSEVELREYIRGELTSLLSPSISALMEDDTDFFSLGVDSLQSIQLRSIISKNIQTNGQKLASNIVFDFPTVRALARALHRMRSGDDVDAVDIEKMMESLISKYSVFGKHSPEQNSSEGQYVVVTGATGSLGAHLVSQLIVRSNVQKVYCLVRASSPENAHLRIIRSLREREIYHDLPLEARKKIVALPSDFSQANLGLTSELYYQIALDITSLIHCAWSVNFNKGLSSFEGDCIAGAHNLISLCLAAKRPEPANFNFCSSVSAVAATEGGRVPESLPAQLTYAQGMGYAQSKLVTENICVIAAEKCGIKTRVLRVGQVIADTVHGIWNATEAIPLMIQAAKTVGAIPRLDENPLWLPVDVVAASVKEISLGTAGAEVVNVVNHQSFHWTRDLLPALHAAGLQFSELSQKAWVDALRKSNPDPVANPPIKLVEFFASKYDNDNVRNGLAYDTTLARALSPSLAAAPVLNQAIVDRFVKHWEATSWVTQAAESKSSTMIVIAGPCGVGKSTIARALSTKYSIPWIEGDEMHSAASIAKMAANTALLDSERWKWLQSIKSVTAAELAKPNVHNVIVTCSALKRSYRDVLRSDSDEFKTVFLMLQGTKGDLIHRVNMRQGHYMKEAMVDGQIEILEGVGVGEVDVVPIDTTRGKEAAIAEANDALQVYFA